MPLQRYSFLFLTLLLCLISCQSKEQNESLGSANKGENIERSLLSPENDSSSEDQDSFIPTNPNHISLYNWAHTTDSIIQTFDSLLLLSPPTITSNATWSNYKERQGVYGIKKTTIDSSYSYKVEIIELFIEINGKLRFALESTEARDSGNEVIDYWNCMYELDNNSVIRYISHGHGETETDEWSEESILDQWKECRKEFDSIILVK